MKSAMQKDFWREIKHTKSRFFSMMILVALSVAFLSGLKATAPDMKKTGDNYLDSLHLADIQVLSTLGLTEDDIDALRAQGVRRMWLEVIRDNHAAVALYQSLGFEVRHGLCGYLSAQAASGESSVLQEYDVLALTRRAGAEINGQLPWLMDPLTFSTLPCRALSLHQQAFAVLATLSSRPQLQFLWVDPAARGRGLGQEMLRTLAQRFPGLGTSVTIPERFTPLFHAAGYTPMALKQYEMSAALSALPSAGR